MRPISNVHDRVTLGIPARTSAPSMQIPMLYILVQILHSEHIHHVLNEVLSDHGVVSILSEKIKK